MLEPKMRLRPPYMWAALASTGKALENMSCRIAAAPLRSDISAIPAIGAATGHPVSIIAWCTSLVAVTTHHIRPTTHTRSAAHSVAASTEGSGPEVDDPGTYGQFVGAKPEGVFHAVNFMGISLYRDLGSFLEPVNESYETIGDHDIEGFGSILDGDITVHEFKSTFDRSCHGSSNRLRKLHGRPATGKRLCGCHTNGKDRNGKYKNCSFHKTLLNKKYAGYFRLLEAQSTASLHICSNATTAPTWRL